MPKLRNKIIPNIVLSIGILLILLPIIFKIISHFNQSTVINNYNHQVSQMQQDNIDLIQKNSDDFNTYLYKNNTFDSSLSQDSISDVDFSGLDILAYLTIPKINVELPIYEGCSDNVLSLGIGHLSNTSLPCGGNNTHCVLIGHTGLSTSILFDDLDKLEIGDTFSINFLGNILSYEINNINTVEPNDTKSLIIKENEDLVTLITCTPKHVNTHRLLVTGSRINLNNNKDLAQNISDDNDFKIYDNFHDVFNFIIYICFALFIICLIFMIRKT